MAGRRVLPQLGFVPCSIIAGILFLVIVALAQAIAETHPDAVSDRHHGDEFLSRRAHEGGYRRSGSRHRVDQGGLFGMNLGDEEDDGTFKPGIGRGEDEEVEEVEVVEEIVEVEEDDEGSDAGETTRAEASRGGSTSASNAHDDDDRFDEFPASLTPINNGDDGGGGTGDQPSCDAGEFIEHAEFWGDVVVAGTANAQTTAAKCCESCAKIRSCTVWVWNPSSHECWLKTDEKDKPKPVAEGAHVPWTSGVLPKRTGPSVKYRLASDVPRPTPPPKCLHTVLTSSGNAYMNWQTRVMYRTYLKHAAEPGSILKAFTRILHRGKDDELMFEVPTMRFDPNQGKCDQWCEYPVADRSLAVAQWSRTTDSMRCSHVMMVETDYIYVKSPSPNILTPPGKAVGFEYSYIYPQDVNMKRVYEAYMSQHAHELPGRDGWRKERFALPRTGNAPSCLNVEDLRRVAPLWAEFVALTESPEEVRKALGWLRDMYAYDAAALAVGVEHVVAPTPKTPLMAQPPADEKVGDAFLLHYTWGPEIYDAADNKLWVFDKRSYGGGQYQRGPYPLSKIPDPPAWDPAAGLQLQSFFQPRTLSESKLALIRLMIDEFNEAVGKLPRIPKGHATLEEAQAMAA